MCGIAGIITSKKSRSECQDLIRKTLKVIEHRGLDDRGTYSDKGANKNLCLGVNRLSIIDLSDSGHQPMSLEGITMVYNGEVYNYLEIKEELKKKGHFFRGDSDTEVILHAFKEWGVDAFSKFIGMFAMAVFDKASNRLHLIRDRVGEKPLYYYIHDNLIMFSSELKGILIHDFVEKKIDTESLFSYMVYNSTASPDTIYEKIKQVEPGEIVEFSFKGEELSEKHSFYWTFPSLCPDESLKEEKVLKDLEKLIYDAVKIRLRSDVPLGVFLSGGIDSSLIASIASEISPNIKTFTIGYRDKKHNESNEAEFVAKRINVDHKTIMLEEEDANINFKDLAYMSDDGTANITFLPYRSLAFHTRKDVKVALSGDGGDEFFCGYKQNYKTVYNLFKYRHLLKPLLKTFHFNQKAKVVDGILNDADNIGSLMAQFVIRKNLRELRNMFSEKSIFLQAKRRINVCERLKEDNIKPSFWSLNYYDAGGNYLTETVLKTTDRSSMYNNLETRAVFTDHRIVEYMACVPESLITKRNIDKYILRKILSKYLPESFVFHKKKKGFSVPITSDYKRKWTFAINEAQSIYRDLRPPFLNLDCLHEILEDNARYGNTELKTRLVFLANFMSIWA